MSSTGEKSCSAVSLYCAMAALLSACAADQVNRDFDASRDFAAYRSWSWKDPALQYRPDDPRIKSDLTEQRIRQAVADQLDQRGLRIQLRRAARVTCSVQTYLIVEDRQQQVTTNYGGGWGGPWNGYWGAPMYNETRNIDLQGRDHPDRPARRQGRQTGVARQR
jgi:hypothetical protein